MVKVKAKESLTLSTYFALELLQRTDSRVAPRQEHTVASRITAPQLHVRVPITGKQATASTAARYHKPHRKKRVKRRRLCMSPGARRGDIPGCEVRVSLLLQLDEDSHIVRYRARKSSV